jgi:hypothetical protein
MVLVEHQIGVGVLKVVNHNGLVDIVSIAAMKFTVSCVLYLCHSGSRAGIQAIVNQTWIRASTRMLSVARLRGYDNAHCRHLLYSIDKLCTHLHFRRL